MTGKQSHLFQPEVLLHFQGRAQVSKMNRVEAATEKSNHK
jgi:hypothetical protein